MDPFFFKLDVCVKTFIAFRNYPFDTVNTSFKNVILVLLTYFCGIAIPKQF